MLSASTDSKGIINIISLLHQLFWNFLPFSCFPAGVTSFLRVCIHSGLAFCQAVVATIDHLPGIKRPRDTSVNSWVADTSLFIPIV